MHTLDGGESYGGKRQAARGKKGLGVKCAIYKIQRKYLWEGIIWAKIYMRLRGCYLGHALVIA